MLQYSLSQCLFVPSAYVTLAVGLLACSVFVSASPVPVPACLMHIDLPHCHHNQSPGLQVDSDDYT